MTNPTPPGLKNWLMLLSLGVIWGASFMGSKMALTGFGPLSVAAGRISIGAILLTLIAYAMGRRLPGFGTPTEKRIWLHSLGVAIFSNALPFALLSWGQLYVSSGFAGISMAVVPLLVLPLAHFLIPGEVMSRQKFIGFLIGFAGVAFLIGPAAFGTNSSEYQTLGRLACVGAAASYATGTIITRLCPKTSVMGFSASALLLSSIIILPLAFVVEGLPQNVNLSALGGLLYLGVMPTAIAMVLLVQIINSAGPTFMVLVNYQVPIWAVLFGVLLLNEELPGPFLGALSLILLGLAVSQIRLRKSKSA